MTIASFSQTSGVIFDCTFSVVNWNYIANAYQCRVTVVVSGNENILLNVTGKHVSGKGNFDVETINVMNQDQKYIPRPIASIFPNLRGLQWYKSNLWEITANDLQPFPYLMNLNLEQNKLMSLEADLFIFTPRLRVVNFNGNFLYHVGVDLLAITKLPFLTEARFQSNPCYNDYELSQSRIAIMNEQLSRRCPPIVIETTTVVATSSSETTETESCPYGCLQLISSTVNDVLLLEQGLTNLTHVQTMVNSQSSQKLAQFEERIAAVENYIRGTSS